MQGGTVGPRPGPSSDQPPWALGECPVIACGSEALCRECWRRSPQPVRLEGASTDLSPTGPSVGAGPAPVGQTRSQDALQQTPAGSCEEEYVLVMAPEGTQLP